MFTDQSKNTISWADPVSLNAARRSYQRSNSFGVPLLIACGIGFLVLSSYLYQRTGAFVAKAVRAPGQVVRLHETDSSDASTTYAPVVEYTDDQGQRHEFVDSWSSSPPSYRTGDEVQVLYNPRNPREAQIDRGRANYWVSILIGSAGALFTFLGALSFKKLLKLQAANPFTCGF